MSKVPPVPKTNETGLICIRLPYDVCATSGPDSPRYLSIIQDEGCEPQFLGKHWPLPYLPRYETVALACRSRAVLAVDGSLTVNGRRIEPEAYIRRWRQALADAITVEQMGRHTGLQVLAEIDFEPRPAVLMAKPKWINPPYVDLAALLVWYLGTLQTNVDGLGRCRVTIDLAAPNGARDVWWLDDGLDRESGSTRLVIESVAKSNVNAVVSLEVQP